MSDQRKEEIKTLLVLLVGFAIIAYLQKNKLIIYIALPIIMPGFLSTKAAKIILFIWLKIGEVMSYIMPKIILTLVFYFCLVPLAFMMKLFKIKRHFKLSNKGGSTFQAVNKTFEEADFKNPW
ncbi:MAG: SxtJ family membrane protein [Bacteroidota bacterium]